MCPYKFCTYRLVGDNVDENVKPRHMTCEHQTNSLHYFHTYAVKDMIDLSHFSDDPPNLDTESVQLDNLLPPSSNEKVIRKITQS